MAFTHGGGVRIEAKGLQETIKALRSINKELPREFKKGLKQDAKPILTDARNNAQSIARTGAYASSMAMRAIPVGVPQGNPPRALVRAVLDNEDAVVDAVETRIEQTIRKWLNG